MPFRAPVFKTGALANSANSPQLFVFIQIISCLLQADRIFLHITKRRRKGPEFIRGDINRRSLPTFLSVLIGLQRYDIYPELV
jgi:hypothetical protein